MDHTGSLVPIEGKVETICDTIYFESELSSIELLANQEQHTNVEMPGALQLKKGLDEKDFMTVQIRASIIPQCALVNDINSIKIVNNLGEFHLNTLIKSNLSSKALLFARMANIDGEQKYVADIISYDE